MSPIDIAKATISYLYQNTNIKSLIPLERVSYTQFLPEGMKLPALSCFVIPIDLSAGNSQHFRIEVQLRVIVEATRSHDYFTSVFAKLYKEIVKLEGVNIQYQNNEVKNLSLIAYPQIIASGDPQDFNIAQLFRFGATINV